MKSDFSRTKRRVAQGALLAGLAAILSGCIGIYDNTSMFQLPPNEGMPVEEMLEKYGTPSFAGTVGSSQVYTYKVRDNKYIVLVGIYEGYDLVVTTDGKEVRKVARADRPNAFCLFNPLPWAEAE